MDGGGKPAVFKQKKLKRGNLHILFIPPQHRQLAEKEHNDLLIMFSIPMGMKFISLEECLKKHSFEFSDGVQIKARCFRDDFFINTQIK